MHHINFIRPLAFLTAACMVAFAAAAEEQIKLPDDADQAWAEVQVAFQDLQRLDLDDNPLSFSKGALTMAGKAEAFVIKFPKHNRTPQARQMVMQGYAIAAVQGKNEDAGRRLDAFAAKTLADKSVHEDERVGVYIVRAQMTALKKFGDNAEAEVIKAMIEALLAARSEFPGNIQVYETLLMLARQTQDKQIAKAIVDDEKAPQVLRRLAKEFAEAKLPYEIGKPLDIKFTAVDDREVDLSKMKGKVVLIDFWATWCGPCVAELPHVKKVYETYHDKGFEIVAISFDQDKDALVSFAKRQNMPWPQYFDGQGWENKYGVQYDIKSIPTMWLIDKDGNLADIQARENLEQKVAKLLEAKSKSEQP